MPASHMTPEDLSQMISAEVRKVMQEQRADECAAIMKAIKESLRTDFELMGLAAATEDRREMLRKDMEFVRSLRGMWASAAQRIGTAVLMLLLFAVAGLAGYGAWIRGALER